MDQYPKDLGALVFQHLSSTQRHHPDAVTIGAIVECAYFASMRTEESRLTLCTLAFADPSKPDHDPPPLIRQHRWTFSRFTKRIPLTVRTLAKLAPIAYTSALAIAVFCDPGGEPFIWGLVDQEIHQRRTRVFEDDASFGRPGLFEVEIQGIGHISAYSTGDFIGALRANRLVTRRHDALREGPVFSRLTDSAFDLHFELADSLGPPFSTDPDKSEVSSDFLVNAIESWIGSMCRILHRIQRYNHGGAILYLGEASKPDLNIKHALRYARLQKSLSSQLRATAVATLAEDRIQKCIDAGTPLRARDHEIESDARFEAEDADYATDGAVAFIAALSQIDGLVLMGPGLVVHGFGVEILVKRSPRYVYIAGDTAGTLASLRQVEATSFGTRHRSMFRYCNAHPRSVGFVVSQDGDIRAITKIGKRTVVWEELNLYKYEHDAFAERATRSAAEKRASSSTPSNSFSDEAMEKLRDEKAS